jgi:protein-S-isoprenylcysteine O-methyltransferase Ste14
LQHPLLPGGPTFILARAAIYATLFVGLLLVFVPGRLLDQAGIPQPTQLGAMEYAGLGVGAAGAAIALWCIITFVVVGRGTPAPFDPPRRLVVRGPYRFVRNPMYLGAVLALSGASLYYRSVALSGYALVFLLATHILVVTYEEPTLARLFGPEYDAYRARVGRWLIRRSTRSRPGAG